MAENKSVENNAENKEKFKKTIEIQGKIWYNKRIIYFVGAQTHAFCVRSIVFDRKKVEFLSKEAISRVLRAEAEANALREKAREDAREKINACQQACEKEAENTVAKTVAELKARQEIVRERADALITQSREEAGADIEELRAAASEKMREAVKHIEWELCDL